MLTNLGAMNLISLMIIKTMPKITLAEKISITDSLPTLSKIQVIFPYVNKLWCQSPVAAVEAGE
jgi:hypothetical protein